MSMPPEPPESSELRVIKSTGSKNRTLPGVREVASDEWEPPVEFDDYRLVSCIGKGAMGRVYEANDTKLQRLVAIKFIDAARSDAIIRERFLVEARAAAALQHANVVGIYRIGEVDGHPYIASEFVRGDRLDQIPRPVSNERALQIALGLARGLAAAHQRNVINRDIKPANIMLCDGLDSEVKLLDFGIAKFVDGRDPQFFENTVVRLEPKPFKAPSKESAANLDGAQAPDYASTPQLQRRAAPNENSLSGLTLDGTVMGTPGYIAPEIWQSSPATFCSDVYSVGAVLYQMCTGLPPHIGKTFEELRQIVLTQDARPLTAFPNVDPKLGAIILRCLNRDPALRFPSAVELLEALEGVFPDRRIGVLPEGNPYRGLQAFEAEHHALFFGRNSEIRAILDRLRNDSFVLVAGMSGVGKSSLCRAGVLPRLSEWGLWDDRRWDTALMTPGKRPSAALATALAPYLALEEEALGAWIRRDWPAVYGELHNRQKEKGPLIIFIDQLEELVTLSEPAEAALMVRVLESFSVETTGLRLLSTVRGDFLVPVGSLPGLLSQHVTSALYLLKPLNANNIRQAIVGPARAKGVEYESSELVESLVKSTAEGDGALPLLQFALAELWDARDTARNVISGSALDAGGGVTGALARHADGVIASLMPEQRKAARRLLPLLVTLVGTRARQTEEELGVENENDRRALAALVRGRLLTASNSPDGAAYEVAHEALITSWPTLRHWLDEDADRRVIRDRLSTSINEWERLGRKRDALWNGRQLLEAQLLERSDLLPRERLFLAASRRAVQFRRRLTAGALAGLVVALAATYFGVQVKVRRDLNDHVQIKMKEGSLALDQAREKNKIVETLRAQAFSAFDNKAVERGEELWSKANVLARDVDTLYLNAGQSLEAAAALKNHNATARGLLADVLHERALLAERDFKTEQRDELLSRLTTYDEGSHRAKWLAPGRLDIESIPSGALVTVQRYRERESQNPVLESLNLDLTAPVQALELPQGSYLLTLSASGRETVRIPLLLRRGELRRVSLGLPPAASVPKGFVYVPQGAFLLGSSMDPSIRKDYLNTVPLHEVTTGSYLIAKHETTFGEWLEYLDSLGPAERSKRAASLGGREKGALSLELIEREWQLTLQLNSRHVMSLKDAFHFSERKTRQDQDWHLLPAVGVTSAEIEAYLVWMQSSSKLKRARLCTEIEWERAARGADGREYPHGNFLSPHEANFDETYGKTAATAGPDEVGAHPASRSPFGIDDMTGNAWEFTTSSLGEGKYVLRGGGYSFGRIEARSGNRYPVPATFKSIVTGFRVCANSN